MIVAEQHGVDGRQILKGYPLLPPAPGTCPGQRTRPLGPNRVRQNVAPPLLKENGRVVHQSGSQFATLHAPGRYGLLDVRDETGRGFGPAGQFPSKRVKESGRLRSIGIVKALSVKVLWESRIECALLHESPLIRNLDVGGVPASWQFTPGANLRKAVVARAFLPVLGFFVRTVTEHQHRQECPCYVLA
jgi:hypothetical protein